MCAEMQHLKLVQVQRQLEIYEPLRRIERPRRGWLKVVREALGRTERQQALLAGISGPALHKAEASEADERITLGQLRRLADGLGCDLVYSLVPRRPLTEIVADRAQGIAREDVNRVAHSMGLEGQRPSERLLKRQIQQRTDELIRGRWSVLWRE